MRRPREVGVSRVGRRRNHGHKVSCRRSGSHVGELKEAAPPPAGAGRRSYGDHMAAVWAPWELHGGRGEAEGGPSAIRNQEM